MPRVIITDQMAQDALDVLHRIFTGEIDGTQKTLYARHCAAAELYRFYMTQHRYQLSQQTLEDYERALRHPNWTRAKELEALTPEGLLALQCRMAGHDAPWTV